MNGSLDPSTPTPSGPPPDRSVRSQASHNPAAAPGTTLNEATRSVIHSHWASANARDWEGFAELLDPDLRYDVPQTREYIDGAVGYVDMFRTWPGAWEAKVQSLVCEGPRAVCIIDFVVGADVMAGISVFELAAGRIVKVVDYWPELYEPPPRTSKYMKRAAGDA